MEVFLMGVFWIGMLKIIWVNILLSGDNAVVIALASRSLPQKQQKQAVIWGAMAAIVMRIFLTLFAIELLQLPWLKVVGALLLLWIGIGLINKHEEDENVRASGSLFSAIKTILIADLVMSLDNVLAVAAAAQASMPDNTTPLVVLGLAMSVPAVIFGSQLLLKIMNRFPVIITLGAMLIGWIAGEMIAGESALASLIENRGWLHWILPVFGALFVLMAGKYMKQFSVKHAE